jgi:hypothetical protein
MLRENGIILLNWRRVSFDSLFVFHNVQDDRV